MLSLSASVDVIAERPADAAHKLVEAIALAKATGAHPNEIRIEGLERRLAALEQKAADEADPPDAESGDSR